MTYHPIYELVPCEIKGCGKMHGVRVVSSNVSALRPTADDSTAVLGDGVRGDASAVARSADVRAPGSPPASVVPPTDAGA